MLPKAAALFPDHSRPLLFAHRGCSTEAPENTVPAFDRAAELGIPGIELDLQQCASGELLVIHDFELSRLAGVSGHVAQLPWSYLRELDVGASFSPRHRGTGIPLLRDIFARYGTRFLYDIEIKHDKKRQTGFEHALADLIEASGVSSRCIVSSFNPFALRAMRRAAPHLPQALIFSAHREVPWLFRRGRGRFLAAPLLFKPHHEALRRPARFLRRALAAGAVIPWTVNDQSRAAELRAMGVAGLISDNPERLAL
jgi:glycerophosphoryl diester phosphodiesterase